MEKRVRATATGTESSMLSHIPAIQAVVVFDTSTSMEDEIAAFCAALPGVQAAMNAVRTTIEFDVLG